MDRIQIEKQIEELEAEIPEWEKMGMVEEATRVARDIVLFKIALQQPDAEIEQCQATLPGRASILRMAEKLITQEIENGKQVF